MSDNEKQIIRKKVKKQPEKLQPLSLVLSLLFSLSVFYSYLDTYYEQALQEKYLFIICGIWGALMCLLFFLKDKDWFYIPLAAFIIGIAGVLAIVFALPHGMISVQIPDFRNGIFDAINERLESFYNNYGGSTYLMNEYVYDYPSLFTGTIQRMLYFFCAPFPSFWRGLGDAAAFFMSAFVYIICVVTAIVSMFAKKRDSYRFVMGITVFVVSGIFAWMVSNSGTAMRHRTKFLGIVVLLGMYSAILIRNQWKKRKKKNTN